MAQKDEDFDAVRKEVAAEIAAINAGKPNHEDLVRELAVTKLLLRYAETTAAYRSEAFSALEQSIQTAQESVTLLETERQLNETLKEQQSKLINLLPKVFKAGEKSLSKRGVNARHNENRAMKQEVFAWLDTNFSTCTSMDDAAEKMAGKLVPCRFRTVRDWVGEWKKLRSTGTP